MSMKGEPVPPEGLDYIKSLEQWLEQHPNDVMVRSKLEAWPESHWPGFTLRQSDVLQSYAAQ